MSVYELLTRFFKDASAQPKPRVVATVTTAIIPAGPGFNVLTLHDDGSVTDDPVIGWVCDSKGGRQPISAGEDKSPTWVIEFPSAVVDTRERSFENREVWRETLLAERAAAALKATL